jgi:hypothetical protein
MWLADGTFSAAPNQFLQLFTIHGYYQQSVFPFVVMLMTRRTQSMYVAMFSKLVQLAADKFSINLTARFLTTDFEMASMNAFREVFPGVTVSGCHFHLCQAIIRKCNEFGLKANYRDDADFAIHVRMLMALPFLPADVVPSAFESVKVNSPAIGAALMAYFDATYVKGPIIRGSGDTAVHRVPMFPPSVWNVCERFLNLLPTTNNHVEAWHRRLQSLIVIDHPSFYNCLHKLRQEQRHIEIELLRLDRGFRQNRRRRSIGEQQKRITTLMADMRSGRKDVPTFLRSVAHSFCRYTEQLEEVADQVMVNNEESSVVDQRDHSDQQAPTDIDRPGGSSSTDQQQSENRTATPRRLRELPSRRNRRTETTATEATPAMATAMATAATSAMVTSATVATAPPGTIANSALSTSNDCPVCLQSKSDTAIIPCGHCACASCIRQLMCTVVPAGTSQRCPVCRTNIRDIMKLHF